MSQSASNDNSEQNRVNLGPYYEKYKGIEVTVGECPGVLLGTILIEEWVLRDWFQDGKKVLLKRDSPLMGRIEYVDDSKRENNPASTGDKSPGDQTG